MVRAYQYHLAERGLNVNTVKMQLSVLASFAKWSVRHGRMPSNPFDRIVVPATKKALPKTLRWDAVQVMLARCTSSRDKALIALMAYEGLRRGEVVGLNLRDLNPSFGLRRVFGKGGGESAVPLPQVARQLVADYIAEERSAAAPGEPLFVVTYRTLAGKTAVRRMAGHRIWKIVSRLGKRQGDDGVHPHAFRHACAAELLRRTRNLKAVQEHLRHSALSSTIVYTKLMPQELEEIVKAFDS